MKAEYAVETRNLCKYYNGQAAIVNLNLQIQKGEVFGFLGPNGAGKTTAVKMLLGLVTPTSGEGFLCSRPIGLPSGRDKVGFLPEHFRFHNWLKASEFLFLHAKLSKIPETVSRKRIPDLLELVKLKDAQHKKLGNFSKGMLQRIGLAQALLNEPDLIFLDEPTSGLDPMGRRLVRDIIDDLKKRGTTVFLNSHLLSEVEVTCDRVAFINQGKIVYESTMEDLITKETVVYFEVRPNGLALTEDRNEWGEIIEGLNDFANVLSFDSNTISLSIEDSEVIPQINQYLVTHGVYVYAINRKKFSLEELFMNVIAQEEEE
jgi:ABC-2 type transport system ATP-binding protein